VEPLIDELEPVAAPEVPLVAPVVPDEPVELPLDEPLPIFAFARMKRSLPLALAPEVPLVAPDVPVAPLVDEPLCRQPVTVIVLALLCRELLLVCDEGGVVWAPTLAVHASASAAAPPIHTLRFI
jgi:hypothetical protein